jgi:hypothetical protein
VRPPFCPIFRAALNLIVAGLWLEPIRRREADSKKKKNLVLDEVEFGGRYRT